MLRDAVLTPDCQLYYDYPGPHNRNLFGELPSTFLKCSCSCRDCLHNMTANQRLCNSARSRLRLALLPNQCCAQHDPSLPRVLHSKPDS